VIGIYVISALAFAASVLYAGQRFKKERKKNERKTVEQEKAESYAVAAHAPHWPKALEVHDYGDLDDPLDHVIEIARAAKQ
jgi:hypothetical protein